MSNVRARAWVPLAFGLGLVGCGSCGETPRHETSAVEPIEATEPLAALPGQVEYDAEKMALGRRLYFDPILSGDDSVACATCHSFEHGGAEPRAVSTGIGGAEGRVNALTVLCASLDFAQFWDGRAATLEEQVQSQVSDPVVMGSAWPELVVEVRSVPSYRDAFAAAYADGVTQANIANAIAEYERSLITPSRVDAFLNGAEHALTAQERRGFDAFHDVGCTRCHIGQNIGGSMYQKMGLARDWFGTLDRELTAADMGRFDVTHLEADRYYFKVPTLRNVAQTAPYLHDGSQARLDDVVRIMGRYQLGTELRRAQVDDIVAFLRALDGEIPEHAVLPEDERELLATPRAVEPEREPVAR